jgi:hypothetical protein
LELIRAAELHRGCAWFDFTQLCYKDVGPGDLQAMRSLKESVKSNEMQTNLRCLLSGSINECKSLG